MASVLLLVLGLALLVFGGRTMQRAFERRKQRELIEETPTEDVGSLSMGQSEVSGIARPVDGGTITAPFSDEACLVAVWEVAEFEERNSDGDTTRWWRPRGNGVDAVPFLLDDGTGQVLVRPDEETLFEVDEYDESPILLGHDQDPPEAIGEFLRRRNWEGVDLQDRVYHVGKREAPNQFEAGDRRFTQHLIRPGETVYVFGYADVREDARSADNPTNVVIQTATGPNADLSDMFLVSDKPESAVLEPRRGALRSFPTGAAIATLGFGLVLWGLGVF